MNLNFKKSFKIILTNSLVLASLATSSNVFAARGDTCTDPAVAAVQSMVHEILADLNGQLKKDGKIDGPDVYQLVNKQLVPNADLETTARMVLGSLWKTKLNEAQRQQFITEFTRQMIRTYGIAFEAYDGETVDFDCKPRALPSNKVKRFEVSSIINHNKSPATNVKFSLYNKDDKWKVIDLIVEGVSIVDSYRTVYKAKFQSNNPDAVLKEMHDNNCKDNTLGLTC